MNVKDLKQLLEPLADDMVIVEGIYSDSRIMELDSWQILKGVVKPSAGYVMHSHVTMSDENKAQEQQFLYFRGN